MGRSEAELGGRDFAICGVFFVDIEGDGDVVFDVAPLVCIPGGTGLLILLLVGACVTTGPTGAIVTKTHAAPEQLLFLVPPLYMRIAASRRV